MKIVTDSNFKFSFGKGNFDDYCVYVEHNGKDYKWFTDEDYFRWVKKLSHKYGKDKVYDTFVRLYDAVSTNAHEEYVNLLIRELDKEYKENTQQLWSILYMTMLAEEYKENTILGKRIKRLGVYNILFDGYGVKYTTQYMRGKPWTDLDEEMRARGI